MTLENILFFDAETSIHNSGNPFDPRNFLVSYVTIIHNQCNFKYYSDPDFRSYLQQQVSRSNAICGFNIKFDLHWIRNLGIVFPAHVKIWDCQIAEFINSGQRLSYDSLDAACDRYGLPRKPDRIKQYWEAGMSTEHIPIRELEEYNIHDVESTKAIYEAQQALFEQKQKDLVLLEGEDLKTLQSAEYAGIKVDVEEAEELIEQQRSKVKEINDKLLGYLPSDLDPSLFNFNSPDQLSALLYGGSILYSYPIPVHTIYKTGPKKGQEYTKNSWQTKTITFPARFKPLEGSEVKKTREDPNAQVRFYQVDAPTLLQLRSKKREDRELLDTLRQISDESKIGEMAESLINKITEMNWQDNYIHGQFNQVVARTGRLSSSAPNLQNQPPEIDKLLISRYE